MISLIFASIFFLLPNLFILILFTIFILGVYKRIKPRNLSYARSFFALILSGLGFFLVSAELMIFLEINGTKLSFTESMNLAFLIILGGLIPITFMGIGLREVIFQFSLINYGFQDSYAMKLAFLFLIIDFLINIFCLIISLTVKRINAS